MNIDTGITSEVLTVKSETRLIDIFNQIISIKFEAVFEYVEGLNLDIDARIVVIGTYFTGVGIVKRLSEKYTNILLIDIYPHLEGMLETQIGGKLRKPVEFSSNIDLAFTGDVVIDTTGFGGITPEQSERFDVEAFIIEDPVAEDNDELLAAKNNIHERLSRVKSPNKAIIKTKGIDTKTSGTMTLAVGVLTRVLNECLKKEGVLYSACEMGFFEEVIFKEQDIDRFVELTARQAVKVSTINPFSCDELIENEIAKIHCDLNEA